MPTRSAPDVTTYGYAPPAEWREVPVLLQGEIEVARAPARFHLVVALRQHEGHHRVEACWLNGSLAAVDGTFAHFTLGFRLSETVFDLSTALQAGRNQVRCRIVGSGRRFDVDVYELRS